ncbi:unnamed protein product [Prorocentrum cordatum]|uniref:Uncharacterized protein n=1 Tax=Prorocentrum cordatum TaxID=2364126 RepID=A0ABN9WIA6_9DINO|nr:unnamed protein product [Polarella glacialis]
MNTMSNVTTSLSNTTATSTATPARAASRTSIGGTSGMPFDYGHSRMQDLGEQVAASQASIGGASGMPHVASAPRPRLEHACSVCGASRPRPPEAGATLPRRGEGAWARARRRRLGIQP